MFAFTCLRRLCHLYCLLSRSLPAGIILLSQRLVVLSNTCLLPSISCLQLAVLWNVTQFLYAFWKCLLKTRNETVLCHDWDLPRLIVSCDGRESVFDNRMETDFEFFLWIFLLRFPVSKQRFGMISVCSLCSTLQPKRMGRM